MSSRCPLNNHDPGKTYNKEALTSVLNQKVKQTSNIRGRENKKKHVIEMFDLIIKYKDFVHDSPRFKEIVKAKLIEFAKEDDFVLNEHYQSLFGEPIPL